MITNALLTHEKHVWPNIQSFLDKCFTGGRAGRQRTVLSQDKKGKKIIYGTMEHFFLYKGAVFLMFDFEAIRLDCILCNPMDNFTNKNSNVICIQ